MSLQRYLVQLAIDSSGKASICNLLQRYEYFLIKFTLETDIYASNLLNLTIFYH